MDYRRQYFTDGIAQAKEAIARYSASAAQDEAFIQEFQTSDPDVAEIYRGWKKFNLDKVALIRASLLELTQQYAREYSEMRR